MYIRLPVALSPWRKITLSAMVTQKKMTIFALSLFFSVHLLTSFISLLVAGHLVEGMSELVCQWRLTNGAFISFV